MGAELMCLPTPWTCSPRNHSLTGKQNSRPAFIIDKNITSIHFTLEKGVEALVPFDSSLPATMNGTHWKGLLFSSKTTAWICYWSVLPLHVTGETRCWWCCFLNGSFDVKPATRAQVDWVQTPQHNKFPHRGGQHTSVHSIVCSRGKHPKPTPAPPAPPAETSLFTHCWFWEQTIWIGSMITSGFQRMAESSTSPLMLTHVIPQLFFCRYRFYPGGEEGTDQRKDYFF